MIGIMLVGVEKSIQHDFENTVSNWSQMRLFHTTDGQEALDILSKQNVDLVVINETLSETSGIDLTKLLILKNPLLNCAIVSEMAPDQFHEETEGLGVLAQLKSNTGAEQVSELLEQLMRIMEAVN